MKRHSGTWLFLAFMAITAAVYWPGLSGGWLFDDYPNIVENPGVQPKHADLATLANAALSSPASEFKRPLSSLTFALNYLAAGLDPYWMKLTNLVIHLLNGCLALLLAQGLLEVSAGLGRGKEASSEKSRIRVTATIIAGGWMLLPINLTGVLYVVQREESLANLFVLLGLIGYVHYRRRMLETVSRGGPAATVSASMQSPRRWTLFAACAASIVLPTAAGILAKETAVMLPFYALLTEWVLFRFALMPGRRDHALMAMYVVVLLLPMLLGLGWLLPSVLSPETWATRDFTLGTRLLSESRVIVDYVVWTLLPTPHALSFYHDNFKVSTGLFSPWTTGISILVLAGLVLLALRLRARLPAVTLGIYLFLGCHLLTGTILPLELVYEHRNYFASFGVLLAVAPLLMAYAPLDGSGVRHFVLARRVLLVGLLSLWAGETAMTAMDWSTPLRLAEALANRAPDSPRAEYELGRTYIIYSDYDPASPFTKLAYAPLERAAALPKSSILPEQALIFMNSRMHLPLKQAWWDSLIGKLRARKPGVQDESSLGALTQCNREHLCNLPDGTMTEAFLAALSHPDPSARLLAMYGDYAWNVLDDHKLGLRVTSAAVAKSPDEPAYQITRIRMLLVLGRIGEAHAAFRKLQRLNIGGRLDDSLAQLRSLLRDEAKTTDTSTSAR